MSKLTAGITTILVAICLSILAPVSHSQIAIINTVDSFYMLDQSSCNYQNKGSFCEQINGEIIYSTAIHKDTLYFLGRNSKLYRMKLGVLASCTLLTTLPVAGAFGGAINAMTTDKNGIIYAADFISRELWRYNPYTNVREKLGILNVASGGDMIFYKGKLLLATLPDGIYEINISSPSNSTLYMDTPGYVFYGFLSRPFDCNRNKYYGLAVNYQGTELIELDLDGRHILGASCNFPLIVYDAASNVDDGNTIGVTIDSLVIHPACGNDNKADLRVIAGTATSGGLTYVLDGSITNTTGMFKNISEGNHRVFITNKAGCSKDSLFFVPHGLSSALLIQTISPYSCDQRDGNIVISATSGFPPLTYSLNGGAFQTSSMFNNLAGGRHSIIVQDAKGCQKDTTAFLSYRNGPGFISGISVTPTVCIKKSGSIRVNLPAGINPAQVYCSLNGSIKQQVLAFQNLDAGSYLLSVSLQGYCHYDTTIQIKRMVDADPLVELTTVDQHCLINNGSASIRVTGLANPYLINFNNAGYSAVKDFYDMPPGIYTVGIRSINTCEVETTVEIKPYLALPFMVNTNKIDPTCKELNSGEIKISITGSESYQFKSGNTVYPNGATINNLSKGNYTISILNNDNCDIHSFTVTLDLELTPECNFVHVPNAFTPNGDGLNEIFRAFAGEAVTDFQLLVYNRWGQLLFSGNDKNKGWNGRMNGKIQSNGVYVWMVRYKIMGDSNERRLKGTVVLAK